MLGTLLHVILVIIAIIIIVGLLRLPEHTANAALDLNSDNMNYNPDPGRIITILNIEDIENNNNNNNNNDDDDDDDDDDG
jgi:hypothetical protein